MMENKRTHGVLELILGILMIILGIYTFTSPGTALSGIVVAYGILAILMGIADIVLYVKLERRTGFGPSLSIVSAIFSILAGVLILLNLDAGKWALSILFPIWFIAHCISRLCNLPYTRILAGKAAYWVSLIANVLGILVGFLVLLNPFASSLTLVYFVGAYLVVIGISNVVSGISELR